MRKPTKQHVLISDPLSPEGVAILEAAKNIEVTVKTDHTPEELLAAIPKYSGLIVRSQTRVSRGIIEAGQRLRVIGRAGVGVDNIDVATATQAGIVVVNSPEGNNIAATEHTLALLLSLARNVPAADASLRAGEWKRGKFTGVELYNKTLAVIGLGKIGTEVAKRARAFGMQVLGYDPFVTREHAELLGLRFVTLDEALQSADFVTFHVPLNKDTKHIVNAKRLSQMKDGVRIINCARGGIIDEAALARALASGKVAGAAIDVFEEEPPIDSPLIGLPGVITTPHLGASTAEAQVKVAVDVAEQIVDVLSDRPARSPVNMPAIAAETLGRLQPYLRLVERIGSFHGQLATGGIRSVDVTFAGEIAGDDVGVLIPGLLKGLLQSILDESINYVNATYVAKSRNISVRETRESAAADYASLITVRVIAENSEHIVSGCLFGKNDLRIVRLDDYRLDFSPEGLALIAWHIDQPGLIGSVGTILGSREINIASMQVGRVSQRGSAVMVLGVDERVTPEVLAQIEGVNGVTMCSLLEF
jgi:D-3-phosphoglycerate dehydrogenase